MWPKKVRLFWFIFSCSDCQELSVKNFRSLRPKWKCWVIFRRAWWRTLWRRPSNSIPPNAPKIVWLLMGFRDSEKLWLRFLRSPSAPTDSRSLRLFRRKFREDLNVFLIVQPALVAQIAGHRKTTKARVQRLRSRSWPGPDSERTFEKYGQTWTALVRTDFHLCSMIKEIIWVEKTRWFHC